MDNIIKEIHVPRIGEDLELWVFHTLGENGVILQTDWQLLFNKLSIHQRVSPLVVNIRVP